MRSETRDFIERNLPFIIDDLMDSYKEGTLEFENITLDNYGESLAEFLDDKANREDLDIDLFEYHDVSIDVTLDTSTVGSLLKSLEFQVVSHIVEKELIKFFREVSEIDIDLIKENIASEFYEDNEEYTEKEMNQYIGEELRSLILTKIN